MPVTYKDYYQALGVSKDASEADIKKAFRKLAREYHPDVAKNKKQAEERFKEINEAYEVLGDPEKRKRYDELGPGFASGGEFRPPPGWNPRGGGSRREGAEGAASDFEFDGTGFSDFFNQFMGGRRGGTGGGFRRSGRFTSEDPEEERGRDIEGDILVSLEEVMTGSVRTVTVRHNTACSKCEGTGRRGRQVCAMCGGSGQTSGTESYQVKVPAGVTEGQRLRVPGRGQAGAGGGEAGDLYLRVRLAKHPDFEVEGHNLIYEAELAPWEAVLGASLEVPTLAGSVSIRIPPGTQGGQKLRVRGRGLVHRDHEQGDLIVIARVQVPQKVTDTERELWEKLAKESRFRPRG